MQGLRSTGAWPPYAIRIVGRVLALAPLALAALVLVPWAMLVLLVFPRTIPGVIFAPMLPVWRPWVECPSGPVFLFEYCIFFRQNSTYPQPHPTMYPPST
jgi:hypothetical protein